MVKFEDAREILDAMQITLMLDGHNIGCYVHRDITNRGSVDYTYMFDLNSHTICLEVTVSFNEDIIFVRFFHYDNGKDIWNYNTHEEFNYPTFEEIESLIQNMMSAVSRISKI